MSLEREMRLDEAPNPTTTHPKETPAMSNAWDAASKRQKESGGKFLSLKDDKDFFVGAFVGEPYVRETFYNKTTNKTEDYTDAHKARGDAPKAKFMINVWTPNDEQMHVYEMNAATFGDIVNCKEKYGLETSFFEVKRIGKKGDTSTRYAVLPDKPITPEQLAKIKAAKLHDLAASHNESMSEEDKAKLNTNSVATNGAAAPAAAPAQVVAEADAVALTERAKKMPAEKLNEFLNAINKERIKGMTPARFKEAEAILAKIEASLAPAAAPAEVDPFS